MTRRLRLVVVNLALILVGAIFIEVGALLLHVRPSAIDPSIGLGPRGGREVVPRHYFVAHEERGFDIAKGAKPTRFVFNEGTVEVSGNRYGCFDRNDRFDGDYALLLGDSFVWGYAAYEVKWGTLLEKSLGYPLAKCGVVHTGQRHQLSKGKEVVAAIGHAPKLIIVSHFWNDPHDDLLFPEATVVDGFLIDQAVIEKGAIVRRSRAELEAKVREGIARGKQVERGLVPWIRRRSVIVAGIHRVAAGAAAGRSETFGMADTAEFESVDPGPNRAAIADLKAWADSIGARLFFVLVPRREMAKDYFANLRPFLAERSIEFLDLQPLIMAQPNGGKGLYWKYDPHWNVEGNRFAAAVVDAELKRRFGSLLTPSTTAPNAP